MHPHKSIRNGFAILAFAVGVICPVVATHAAPVMVFSTDFDSTTLPAEISPGTATLTGVQGYAGLGPVGNQFGGNFLRSATGNVVTLSLNNLPQHDTISLEFLFAAIDSLDGTGTFPAGDYFRIVFDGTTLFSESFANATPTQFQSYVPPPGVELARHVDLGFGGPGGYYTDSAYNLGADPRFSNFAHTGSSAQIDFFIFGEGNQSLDDESWAMDNLRVSVTTQAAPLPAAVWLFGSGLLGLIGVARRKARMA
jgi:hypothetical protein